MKCPYCDTEIVVFLSRERILAASRTCPSCKKAFFIENGMPNIMNRIFEGLSLEFWRELSETANHRTSNQMKQIP